MPWMPLIIDISICLSQFWRKGDVPVLELVVIVALTVLDLLAGHDRLWKYNQ